jgi:leucyl/phenylalanyl-tRNA---protein transferase
MVLRSARSRLSPVPWLAEDERFPRVDQALGPSTGLDGLLAIGADLTPERLIDAYRHGIFPWYSEGQPILWWSPDPRMVLYLDRFKISRSLRKTIRARRADPSWQFRFDGAFEAVIDACAAAAREGQNGTWITPEMRAAYKHLHALGHAHSFEAWHAGRLVGGGYGLGIGRMFFGESMFARETDASKLALAALVNTLKSMDFRVIDCQQNTRHLASLGAHEIARSAFVSEVEQMVAAGEVSSWPTSIELPAV